MRSEKQEGFLHPGAFADFVGARTGFIKPRPGKTRIWIIMVI